MVKSSTREHHCAAGHAGQLLAATVSNARDHSYTMSAEFFENDNPFTIDTVTPPPQIYMHAALPFVVFFLGGGLPTYKDVVCEWP